MTRPTRERSVVPWDGEPLPPDEQKILDRHLRKWERRLRPLRDAIEESQRVTEKDLRLIITATLLALLTIPGCASAIVVAIDPVEPGWRHVERRDCVPAGEQVRLADGRTAVILRCPDGEYVAIDRRTGRVVEGNRYGNRSQ